MTQNNECPIPAGILVIIGGKEKKDDGQSRVATRQPGPEILEKFTALIAKPYANIQIITSGSSEPDPLYDEYRKTFNDLGHTAIGHIHHESRQQMLEDETLKQTAEEADAFFFAGGDQLILTSLYGGSDFLTRLKQRYIDEPVVIGGTSAGAMAMSTPMIYAGNQDVQEISGEIKVTTGLEFMHDICIDTHFVHRGRFVRLAQVVATNPGAIGIGIEEDTAVVVREGRHLEIIGSGTVIVIFGFFIAQADMKNFTEKKPVSVRNLKVDILAPGETLELEERNPPHR